MAVIVEANMRLRTRPVHIATVVATFGDAVRPVNAVMDIRAVADPSLCELIDRTTIAAVNDLTRMGLDETAAALLLIQCDGDAAAEAERCAQACRAAAATEVYMTTDAVESDGLIRRGVSHCPLSNAAVVRCSTICPCRCPHAGHAPRDHLNRGRHRLPIGTFGQAAGGNLHPAIVFDAAAAERALRAFDEMVGHCLALGGSITGEHGVGDLERRHLESMVGSVERTLMNQAKAVFDPAGILNPGRAI